MVIFAVLWAEPTSLLGVESVLYLASLTNMPPGHALCVL